MRRNRFWNVSVAAACAATLVGVTMGALAQTQEPAQARAAATPTPAPAAAAPSSGSSLDQFGWLRGCWAGKVEKYDFIEQWSPPRAGMMVGVSHTMVQDKQPAATRTGDYSYLRLEARADGIYYIAIASGKKEEAFKFDSAREEDGRTHYTFTNPGQGFPERIVYVRGNGGWLYANVIGKVGGKQKDIVYPMQHVDCGTGALLQD